MESSGGTSCFSSPPRASSAGAGADALSQTRLTDHLESLLDPSFLGRADVEIVLAAAGCSAAAVGAYSCLLARSPLFRHHISARPAGEKLRFELAELVPGGHRIGREALVSVLGYLYTARPPKVPPQECVDDLCRHEACRPAIDFVVEATYAASGFQIHELVSLFQRRLSEIVDIAFDEDIIPIIIVAHECKFQDLLGHCIQKVAISNLGSTYLEKKLPDDIYRYFKEFYHQSSLPAELHTIFLDPDHESTKIHRALDSGNVDLVGMLLKQSTVTLGDAFPIHYAAAHCKPRVLTELLKLDSANVNMRNRGGYTPLHMACMRLEPDIIYSLLGQGASVLVQTQDGRDALTICKRLTRQEKDVNREMKKGQETSDGYLCISILEQTERTSFPCFDLQVPLEETVITPLLVDHFLIGLLDLEYRVEFAKLFFPSEAQLAMRITEADSTEKFAATRLKEIGLNENPTIDRRLRERFDALTNTVKLGRRFFPNCSSVLDNFLNEEPALTILGSGTPEEELRMRFYELRKDLKKAFNKDKAGGAVIVSKKSTSSSPRLEMSILDTSPSQAVDATDPTGVPSSGPCSQGQLELQSADVVVADDVGVGYKRKLRSAVWDELTRVKRGDDWFAICKRCNKSLSACTKNGTKHLHRHIQTCRSRQATKGPNQSTLKLLQNPQESNITLKKYVFTQEVAIKELASMICVHEYPLSMVEHAGFHKFCAAVQPMFKVVSKDTIRNYILNLYEGQKLSMVKHFQQCQARVAVTTDMWTVDHLKKSYMAITAYYIDDHWKLKSYLLRFIYVPAPHTGEVISDVLQEVLTEWHITRKLSTVSTGNNCTANDNPTDKIPNKLAMGSLMLDGSLLHMCHVARGLNLIVKDGMGVMEKSIKSIRKGVAFWVATPERHESFEKMAYEKSIKYEKRIALDCETRWNSTYVMLRTALDYQKVFVYLGQSEKLFTPCCPTSADWKLARELCDRLKMFFDITEVLSDIPYATVNIFFPKLWRIYLDIRKWQASDDPLIENMSKLLKEKFERYWSDVYCLMAVAIVLDPRYKLHLLNVILSSIYGEVDAAEKVAEVRELLYNLVSQYKDSMEVVAPSTSAVQKQGNDEVFDLFDQYMSCRPVASSSAHTELDLYLNEPTLPRTQQELDIIHWWQSEGIKYPTLQKIARDIMAISVTAVSSETVFGTGERVVSPHRSRLSPQILEAVMCVQDWSRADMLGPDSPTITSLMTCLDDDDEEGEEMEDGEYSTGIDR